MKIRSDSGRVPERSKPAHTRSGVASLVSKLAIKYIRTTHTKSREFSAQQSGLTKDRTSMKARKLGQLIPALATKNYGNSIKHHYEPLQD